MSSRVLPWQVAQWDFWRQQSQRRAHAYLLTGSEGIGLSEFIEQMAHSLLCSHQTPTGEACGHCEQCHLFVQGLHPDFFKVTVLEDKKEISIDQIRALNQKLFETAHQGGYKVAVIEAAERLNTHAFNALLKSIEEPPANTVIILSSYQPSRLPATIKSRCAHIRFAKPVVNEALAWLQTACPQADVALLKKALKVNWGAPLLAKQWLDAGTFEAEQAWQASLNQLLNGQLTTSKAVEQWKKMPEPEAVFDAFYLWSVDRIRAALYQQKIPLQLSWMHFQQSAMQAKQAWLGNANKDLVLETLCLEWLALNQNEAETEHLHPKTIFKSSLIRGDL